MGGGDGLWQEAIFVLFWKGGFVCGWRLKVFGEGGWLG